MNTKYDAEVAKAKAWATEAQTRAWDAAERAASAEREAKMEAWKAARAWEAVARAAEAEARDQYKHNGG